MLSLNATVNADWFNANAVYVGYCDGGSFAGHVDAPLRVGNATLFLRGRAVFDAVLADLQVRGERERRAMLLEAQRVRPPPQPRMAGATDVVLKGCSAGGLATYIHAERLYAFGQGIPGVQVRGGFPPLI